MANNLDEDLTNRYVVLNADAMGPAYKDIKHRVFLVRDGFGASSFTRGTALFGTTPVDGVKFRMEGYDVERFATDEEIAAVAPQTRWFINEEGTVYEHVEATQRAAFPNDDHVPYVTKEAAEIAAAALAEDQPNVFRFLVTVETDTVEHAEQVMNERINPDEDYGFDYTVDWGAAP